MGKPKQHHWWPRCVSKYWTDERGFVSRVDNAGQLLKLQPSKAARIGHGHAIKLGSAGEETPWDESYEHHFDDADGLFPKVIERLKHMVGDGAPKSRDGRFSVIPSSKAEREEIAECIVSLAVRAPEFRERCVGVAERCRGPIPEAERNSIIGLNQRSCHRAYADSFRGRCKIALLISADAEFVYGDGMYSTLHPAVPPVSGLDTILAPVTPEVSVILTQPMASSPEPNLVSTMVSASEVAHLNEVVQAYSARYLFFRTNRPNLTESFLAGEHHHQLAERDTVRQFCKTLPGVHL